MVSLTRPRRQPFRLDTLKAGPARVCRASHDAGFSLVEVLIAAGIFAAALVGLADLMTRAVVAGLAARRTTYAVLLAEQKVEELAALAYGFDAAGLPTTDVSSDTARAPTAPAGGTGLTPSGASLARDTSGFVDYVDGWGTRRTSQADGGLFVRRWSLESPAGWADDGLVVQVYVSDRPARGPVAVPGHRQPGEARLFTVRARLAR
jgi:type II secretory pathway pseudopilin PulG